MKPRWITTVFPTCKISILPVQVKLVFWLQQTSQLLHNKVTKNGCIIYMEASRSISNVALSVELSKVHSTILGQRTTLDDIHMAKNVISP
jgi:hypothetical protein